MMSQEKNDEITLVGADQPAGQLLRHYWMPAALAVELDGPRPVAPVRLMGEDLVLFRREDNTLGLMSRFCPHRGVDLCYGRLEGGGIRCSFHGWHFDQTGQCTEQPAEPDGSRMHERIKISSYPAVEKNGVIWTYMGPGEPPAFPALDCFRAPDTHVFAFKGLWECNWLQALEIGIDPAHASFLHRFLQDEDPADGYGKQFRDKAAQSDMPMTKVLRDFDNPELKVEETDYGLRIIALRDLGNGQRHVRVTNQVFPCAITIPMSNEMTITQWHVPVDDTHCYWYSMFTSFGAPVDKEKMREQRLKEHRLPDYAPLRNKSNEYGYDPEEQKTLTYTGMGLDINVHDQWAVESMGSVQDRTREHLASSDAAIVRYRRMLRAAIKSVKLGEGELPLVIDEATAKDIQGPISIDAIGPTEEWESVWTDRDAGRRASCSWDAALS
ncbi:Rieske 2Fe-2S domain-containing protein [Nisaea nitritireducens]|uniref:Rieske 2Fe-2S domain-containing protein n=1 Tax=Nisaea nitritireducens TaxID=568392 RepID=UPI001865E01C|nr:Rieske 2Fe-2S domain-containing protein [Nisaea nitritireducens]